MSYRKPLINKVENLGKGNYKRRSILISISVGIVIIAATLTYIYFHAYTTVKSSIDPDNIRLSITLTNVDLDFSSHVGNEWTYEVMMNETELLYNTPLEIKAKRSDLLNFYVRTIEEDKSPDFGSGSKTIDMFDLFFTEGTTLYTTFDIPVTVTEDKGRYTGN